MLELGLVFGEESEHFLPELYPELWYRSPFKNAAGEPLAAIYTNGREYLVKYEDGVRVFVGANAREIRAIWPGDSSFEEALTYVLGPVMAIAAQLRGATCLHGCAVAIDGKMIGLLGQQGAGKSTTAAAFARAGYAVASDDLILLEERPEGFWIQPSYPGVRLWPESVEMLFGTRDALPPLTPTWDKRGLTLTEGVYSFQSDPLPLAAIYLLGERSDRPEAPMLAPVSGGAAIAGLISNSWAHYVNKPEYLARQLQVLVRMALSIPVQTCIPHTDAGRLPALCELLAGDVRAIERFPISDSGRI